MRYTMHVNLGNPTPTERLILLTLQLSQPLTAQDLRALTQTKSPYGFRSALRTLILAGVVVQDGDDAATATYSLSPGGAL
jgi:hypothetical protein